MKLSQFILFALILNLGCNTFTPDDKELRSRADFNLEKTKEFIKNELKSDYTNSKLYYALADVFIKENNKQQAIINLEKAIEYTPGEKEYYKTIIPVLLQQNQWLDAENYSDKLIELSPSFYHAYYYLVVSCVQQNKIEKAGKNIQTLSQINTGYPDLSYLKGKHYLAQKDTADAIYSFKTSIGQNQRISELVFYLIDLYIGKEDYQTAQKTFDEYKHLPDLDKFKFHYIQAKLHKINSKKKLYINELRKAHEIKSDCEIDLLLAEHYTYQWKRDSARYYLAQRKNCSPDKRSYFYQGLMFFQTRNYEEALKNYKIAKDLDPTDSKIRWRHQQAYDSLNRKAVISDLNSAQNQKENTLP